MTKKSATVALAVIVVLNLSPATLLAQAAPPAKVHNKPTAPVARMQAAALIRGARRRCVSSPVLCGRPTHLRRAPESHLRAERSVCWLQFTADEAIEIQHHHKKAKIPGCVAQGCS